MKSLALLSLSLVFLSSHASAYVPSTVDALGGKRGLIESNHGRGECAVKIEGNDLIIYTNVASIKKIVISRADKLISINNSQYRSTRNGKILCGRHGLVSDFHEAISVEPDSIMLSRTYECGEKETKIDLFCSRMR